MSRSLSLCVGVCDDSREVSNVLFPEVVVVEEEETPTVYEEVLQFESNTFDDGKDC